MTPLFAAIHPPKRQPGQAKQSKGDRDADFVHEVRPRVVFAGLNQSVSGEDWAFGVDLCIRRTRMKFRDLCHHFREFASFSCLFLKDHPPNELGSEMANGNDACRSPPPTKTRVWTPLTEGISKRGWTQLDNECPLFDRPEPFTSVWERM